MSPHPNPSASSAINLGEQAFYVDDLTCCGVKNPIGITERAPAFSWTIGASDPDQRQYAFQIQVVMARDSQVVLWDSGMVVSRTQSHVAYQGAPLTTTTRYRYRVRAWLDAERPTSFTAWQNLTVGYLSVNDWPGIWLFAEAALARKMFSVEAKPVVAHLYLAARGQKRASFRGFVNGWDVAPDEMYAPGPGEDFRALSRCYDVTELITVGENVLACIYSGTVSASLVLYHADGTVETVAADGSWRVLQRGPWTELGYNSMHMAKMERYDARLLPDGWNTVMFDDTDWKAPRNPCQSEYQDGIVWNPIVLAAQLVPCRIQRRLKARTITRVGPRAHIIDFGQLVTGFVDARITAPEGTEITTTYAELAMPDENGLPRLEYRPYGLGEHPHLIHSVYTAAGTGVERYLPEFLYISFRYVLVEGLAGDLSLDDFESCSMYSDIDTETSFSSGDAELNLLYAVSTHGLRINLIHIPLDTPGRERRGWTADAFMTSATACMNFRMGGIYRKWFNDFADCQHTSGWIPVELPLSTDPCNDTNWPMACIFIPHDVYRYYGDAGFVRTYLPIAERYLAFVGTLAGADGLQSGKLACYGDWVGKHKPSRDFLANAYWYRGMRLLAELQRVVGNQAEGMRLDAASDALHGRINDRYLRTIDDAPTYDTDSQSSLSHALHFGLVPERHRQAVLDRLIADLERRGQSTGGCLGLMCLIPALTEGGRQDVVLRMLRNTEPGSWLYGIRKYDASAIPEDLFNVIGGSQSHAFQGGSLNRWLLSSLAGIQPRSPGFAEIGFAPYLEAGLPGKVSAQISTVRGLVTTSWQRDGAAYRIEVTVPVNATGVIEIPACALDDLRLDGVVLSAAAAFSTSSVNGREALSITVGSGTHVLTGSMA